MYLTLDFLCKQAVDDYNVQELPLQLSTELWSTMKGDGEALTTSRAKHNPQYFLKYLLTGGPLGPSSPCFPRRPLRPFRRNLH